MAQHGILLLTFSLLLLALKEVGGTSVWESTPLLKLVPAAPVYFSTVLRIALIAISFILMSVVVKIWQNRRRHRVAFGILVVLLLLFVLWLMPPIPVWFFTALGIIGLLTSLAFMIAVFLKRLARKLEDFLEGPFQFAYWVIFWLVYIISWVKGMLSIPTDGLALPIAFWVGFAWFFVIMIITLEAAAGRKAKMAVSEPTKVST
jgi:O-antigen/teichoic acid export membrane protein